MSNKSLPDPCAKRFDRKKSMVITATPARIRRLRQAYLDGQLKVDSERLAEKLLAFERQLFTPATGEDHPGAD